MYGDWTRENAEQALQMIGDHQNQATIAVVVCSRQHQLARILTTALGPLYVADIRSPALHAQTRSILKESGQEVPQRKRERVLGLLSPDGVAAAAAANFVEVLAASCDCGTWEIPHTWVLQVADRPPASGRIQIDMTVCRRELGQ